MNDSLVLLFIPLAAAALDLLAGDPRNLTHPVQYIGKALDWCEARIRGWDLALRPSGAIVAVGLALIAAIAVKLLTMIPVIGILLAVYFGWTGLALGSLLKEGRNVASLVERNRLPEARKALAMLVSRDTADMDAPAIRRALAETLSENLNDGFVAPFLYLCIFGPAGLWFYKTISTMDSMWGYKTEKYGELGWAGARLDDILAFLPARITAFLMLGAGWFLRLDVSGAYDRMSDDARRTESPNAGWPMAAAAWLMGRTMGGPAVYFGALKDKPFLGPADKPWTNEDIRVLIRLTLFSGLLGALFLAAYFAAVFLGK